MERRIRKEKSMAKEAVILEAFRSPIGRAGDRGVYRAVAYADLVVPVVKALTRGLWTPALIDDIITGAVGVGDVRNPAMFVGFPESVAAAGVGRADASSSQAIAAAARYIMNDDADIMIAAGVETMGRMGPIQPWEIGRLDVTSAAGRRLAGAPTPEMAAMQYPEGWKTAKGLLPASLRNLRHGSRTRGAPPKSGTTFRHQPRGVRPFCLVQPTEGHKGPG